MVYYSDEIVEFECGVNPGIPSFITVAEEHSCLKYIALEISNCPRNCPGCKHCEPKLDGYQEEWGQFAVAKLDKDDIIELMAALTEGLRRLEN